MNMGEDATVEDWGWRYIESETESCSYGIGSDGRIAVYVKDNDGSRCSNDYILNNRSISIIVANAGSPPFLGLSDEAYSALLNLINDICERHRIT